MAGKINITLVSLLLAMTSFGQLSFNGGGTMLKGFSPGLPYGGLHLGIEIPRDDALSFYGRFTHCFANGGDSIQDGIIITARDFNTLPPGNPYYDNIDFQPTMNYNIIEGGTRYYLGDGFDFGWGAYGGSTIMIVFNKVSARYESYNEELYYIESSQNREGSIFALGFGLMGGVKYTQAPMGTFYLDVGISYMIFGQLSTTSTYSGMYNPLLFSLNIGYRKDIFW